MKSGSKRIERTASAQEMLRRAAAQSCPAFEECHTREAWLELLFAHAADAILVHELEGRFVEANPAASEMLGYTHDELLALRPWDVATNVAREEMLALWHGLQRGVPVRVHRAYRCKDGKVVMADVRLTRFGTTGQDLIVVACHDVTERKRLEDQLRASEQLARGQVEALRQALDALAGESAPDKLLGHVLCIMSRRLGAQSVGLWLKDEAVGVPVVHLPCENDGLVARRDADHWALDSLPGWQDDPLGEEIVRTRKPILCDDVEHDPRLASCCETLLAQGIRMVLAVPLLVAGRVIGLINVRCATRRQYRAEEVELAQALAHQATLAIQLTRLAEQNRQAAVLEERNRLARDIHDTLAQGFTGIIVQLEAAEDALLKGENREANRHLRRAGDLARHSLGEARRSVRALRPKVLEAGSLPAALDRLVKSMTSGTALKAELSLAGRRRPLPPEWEENLLHIGQEALTNTLQHAQASHFHLRLVFGPEEVRLELRDDGHGFDARYRNGGFGLTGMRERVARMGGHLDIKSAVGQGTEILVTVPENGKFPEPPL
ncbi:MAG: PAS domain S-box protein [Verrucomicrobia bacterium]|nr:PAS domain S-box protein [Verrucomicrobiota bacterium]